jgi:hypothetical protein
VVVEDILVVVEVDILVVVVEDILVVVEVDILVVVVVVVVVEVDNPVEGNCFAFNLLVHFQNYFEQLN